MAFFRASLLLSVIVISVAGCAPTSQSQDDNQVATNTVAPENAPNDDTSVSASGQNSSDDHSSSEDQPILTVPADQSGKGENQQSAKTDADQTRSASSVNEPSERNLPQDIPDSSVTVTPPQGQEKSSSNDANRQVQKQKKSHGNQNTTGLNQTPASGAQTVVGLGMEGSDRNDLLARGYSSAYMEARVCAITGHFSNGLRCYALFADGHTEWVGPSNRDLLKPFMEQLREKADESKRRH